MGGSYQKHHWRPALGTTSAWLKVPIDPAPHDPPETQQKNNTLCLYTVWCLYYLTPFSTIPSYDRHPWSAKERTLPTAGGTRRTCRSGEPRAVHSSFQGGLDSRVSGTVSYLPGSGRPWKTRPFQPQPCRLI